MNNTRIVMYNNRIVTIADVAAKFNRQFRVCGMDPEDRSSILRTLDLFEQINRLGAKALQDIGFDDLIDLDIDVNYMRMHNCHYINEAFEDFYQLLATIRRIKNNNDFNRIITDEKPRISYSELSYARNDVEFTKILLNSYYGLRGISGKYPCSENKEEEKMIKPVKLVYNDMSATVFFNDGTKTTVTCTDGDKYDENTAIALAYTKRMLGSNANGQWQKSMQVVRQAPKYDDRLLSISEFCELVNNVERFGYELGMWSEAHCIKQLSVLVYNICNNGDIEFYDSDYYKLEDLIGMIKDEYDKAGNSKFDDLYSKLIAQVEMAQQEKENKDKNED